MPCYQSSAFFAQGCVLVVLVLPKLLRTHFFYRIQVFMGLHGSSWVFMGLHGSSWVFMGELDKVVSAWHCPKGNNWFSLPSQDNYVLSWCDPRNIDILTISYTQKHST